MQNCMPEEETHLLSSYSLRMLVDQLYDLYKASKTNQENISHLALTCFDSMRIEVTLFKVCKPCFSWSSCIAIWSANHHLHP